MATIQQMSLSGIEDLYEMGLPIAMAQSFPRLIWVRFVM